VQISGPAFDSFGDGFIKNLSLLHPIVSADHHLNPASGYLDGTLTLSRRSQRKYPDLVIAQRGTGLQTSILGDTTIDFLVLRKWINCLCKWKKETTGHSYKANHFGSSVALDGNLAVVGSQHTWHYIPALQVL
jgi:hypothetical protein